MNAQDVADYLQSHPEFFEHHGELLASVSIPHPHGGRAISLTERQMMTLRDKNKALELKLAELLRYGQENDAIAEKLQRWTRILLLQRSARMLPDALLDSVAEIFSVPVLGMRLWEAADDYADLPCSAPVPVDVISLSNQLMVPYVGAPTEANGITLSLLPPSNVQSMALIPLRRGAAPEAFGVIVLASADPRRFHGGMGTEFLARIGEIASAALTRLLT